MGELSRTICVLWSGFVRLPVFVICVFVVLMGCREDEETTAQNTLAPDFSIEALLGGESFRLSDQIGKPVVINFFASWCTTCGIEANDLEQAYQEFLPKDVVFVGVGIDDTLSKATEYLEKNGISYPAGLDETGSIKEDYGLHGLPYTFFIDRAGYINYVHAGAVPRMLIRFELGKILDADQG